MSAEHNISERTIKMADGLVIREMKPEEIPAVIEILKICNLYWSEDDNEENFLRKQKTDSSLMLVALADNELAEFVMASHDGWARIIWHLAVLPKFRRGGIAKILMEEIVKRSDARGKTKMFYGLVNTKNRRMLAIMKKLGIKKFTKVWVVGKEI